MYIKSVSFLFDMTFFKNNNVMYRLASTAFEVTEKKLLSTTFLANLMWLLDKMVAERVTFLQQFNLF